MLVNNAKVGEGSIIAAGTVIPENTVVEPYSLWMGVPGAFRKKTDDDATQQMILQYAKNYLAAPLAERVPVVPDFTCFCN